MPSFNWYSLDVVITIIKPYRVLVKRKIILKIGLGQVVISALKFLPHSP